MKTAAICPQCGKTIAPDEKKWRPFCSERCKLADLGQWFAGRYAIADNDGERKAPVPDQKPRQ